LTSITAPRALAETHDGVIATILAIVMISIHVAARFERQYGIGALIATGHGTPAIQGPCPG
jgi:preprotein translocase subunit SecF